MSEVLDVLLDACPSFAATWDADENVGEGGERALYVDAGDYARHVLGLIDARDEAELPPPGGGWHTRAMGQRPSGGQTGTWLLVAGVVLIAIGLVGLVLPGPGMVFIPPGVALVIVGLIVRYVSRPT